MNKYDFSLPIGSMDQIHAARQNEDGAAVTACGITRQLAARNPIILDIFETTCKQCVDAMGWQTGTLNFKGNDIPVRGTKEQLEKWGATPV